jgi:excinuclease ABC subunit A
MPRNNNKNNIIKIKGARVHNLKNVSLGIPRDKFVVITGLSGSGKSSLAFDTIYAEGQRRYVESLSSYARQFLGLMDKPDVDQIDGLSPAISIDQKSVSHNPRSTVGTVTEIYDYLRLLYSRAGIPHCPKCGQVVEKQTVGQILDRLAVDLKDKEIVILAPIIRDKKGEHKKVFEEARKSGFQQVRVDSTLMSIDEAEDMDLDKQKKHTVDVLVDQLDVSQVNTSKASGANDSSRLYESLEVALDLGDGLVTIVTTQNYADDTRTDAEASQRKSALSLRESAKRDAGEFVFSQHFACASCSIDLEELEPRNFSFNSPHGACPECTGLGNKQEIDPDLILPNKKLTIAEGAVRPWSRSSSGMTWQMRILEKAAKENGFSIHSAIKELTKKQIELILYGAQGKKLKVGYDSDSFSGELSTEWEGVIPNLMRRYRESDSDYVQREIERYMRQKKCPKCQGRRLRDEPLAVTVAGLSIDQVVNKSIAKACDFFELISQKPSNIKTKKHKNKKTQDDDCWEPLTERQYSIAKQIIKEINNRLKFLLNVGLTYLTLDRSAHTLSGGEAQRIRLATQIGSSLVGVVYILDEPSIGLHQRDNQRLISTLKKLKDLGNTVLVVEHDEETILAADYVIDIGPGAGEHGGEVVAAGTPSFIRQHKNSLTGKYLSNQLDIAVPEKFRKGNGKKLTIKAAEEHNLKKVDVEIPLGKFVCITGVSGSGKSTLMTEILSKALAAHFFRAKDLPGKHKEIQGLEHIDKVITIDQSPIGRTPRSNPATYTGVFTPIRELFTQVPEARMRGYKAGRFSFNVKGGRCEACQGDGLVKIEMHFLPDVYVECDECHGRRYNKEALEIHWNGKNIADVLEKTVDKAMNFFSSLPNVHDKLKTLHDVGLGYIKLGQSATTLSGGEAQRIKLATELSRRSTGKTLYILDEPTTGLHFEDVKRLLNVLNQLVDKSNSVLVIEHNLDVIKSADWVIDLGPDGGDAGGEVVASGTPKDVAKIKASHTGQFLKKALSNGKVSKS